MLHIENLHYFILLQVENAWIIQWKRSCDHFYKFGDPCDICDRLRIKQDLIKVLPKNL